MSAKEQIEKLANFIMKEVDDEPSVSEGAGDCAIRIIKELLERVECAEADADMYESDCFELEDTISILEDELNELRVKYE